MNLKFEIYEHLIKEIRDIREEVFVFEQGFKEEFNENDDKSIHVLCYVDEIPIGTSRIIYSKKHQSYSIGRVAVKKEYRKMGIGRLLMKRTEEEIVSRFGHIEIGVSSQLRAIEFYKKIGYEYTADRYLDENYPHVWMIKKL